MYYDIHHIPKLSSVRCGRIYKKKWENPVTSRLMSDASAQIPFLSGLFPAEVKLRAVSIPSTAPYIVELTGEDVMAQLPDKHPT